MNRPRRLLTIGHSYVVALNRRLAHEMARAGTGQWNVTAVAPSFMAGDLRPIMCELNLNEECHTVRVPAYLTSRIHAMTYGARLRAVLAESWDIVHAWEEPYIVAGAQIAGWTRPKSHLVFATFQNIDKRYPWPFSWLEQYAMGRASGWIPFGQMVETTLVGRAGYRDKPRRVIPVGVDTAVFRPDSEVGTATRAALGWDASGPPVVGYLGRFVEEKGVRLLMAALDRLRTRWRALFVGGGPLEAELRAWAVGHGDRVRILTGVTHDAVPAHLNAMDVLAAPSQTLPRWREQLGRMLIEAFACGVPVVGSDSGEIPHVIDEAGRVVGEADVGGWVTTLGELLENQGTRAALAAAGHDRAEQCYSWPVVARRHLDFFESLPHGPGAK